MTVVMHPLYVKVTWAIMSCGGLGMLFRDQDSLHQRSCNTIKV